MRYITIEGGTPLRGEVAVQGAKNSVLPILAATLLSGDVCRIEGCPHLSDVDSAADILRYLGCAVQWDEDDLLVDSTTLTRCDIPQTLMRRMRSNPRPSPTMMVFVVFCVLGDMITASILFINTFLRSFQFF